MNGRETQIDKPSSRRRPAVQVFAACVGVLILLFARRPELFLHPQFWAEDGPVFFVGADTDGAHALVTPYNGYHHLLLRLIAAAARPLDARLIPVAYIAALVGVLLLLVAALHSRRVDLRHPTACAFAIVLIPHTGEALGSLTNLQWLTALGLVWLLLARDPVGTLGWIVDLAIAGVVGLTGVFSALFLPMFVWRAWKRKTAASFVTVAILTVAAAIQIWAVAHWHDHRDGNAPFTLGSAAWLVGFRLPASLFLPPGLAATVPRAVLVGLGALASLILLLAGVAPGVTRKDRVVLCGCVAALLLGTIFRFRDQMDAFAGLNNGDRYFFVPKLLSMWALIQIWGVPVRWGRIAAGVATGCVIFATLGAWRYESLRDYHWAEYAQRIERGESVTGIPLNPNGMTFSHPGRH